MTAQRHPCFADADSAVARRGLVRVVVRVQVHIPELLDRDPELAIVVHGHVVLRNARRPRIEIVPVAERGGLGRVDLDDAVAAADRPYPAAGTRPRFEQGARVAGLAELVRGTQPGDAGTEDDDRGAVGSALQLERRGCCRVQELEREHRRIGGPAVGSDRFDEITPRSHPQYRL